uniref:Uncharacterized protein n=1 Tax=Oryza glumipatula TaxID=40148 RepID=A0A0E0AZP4_9ORYZ
VTISPRPSSPRKSQNPIRSTKRWRENVWWFRDSVGGDRKAVATPQVIAGDPFGIKPAYLLLSLLRLHRQGQGPHQWLQTTNPGGLANYLPALCYAAAIAALGGVLAIVSSRPRACLPWAAQGRGSPPWPRLRAEENRDSGHRHGIRPCGISLPHGAPPAAALFAARCHCAAPPLSSLRLAAATSPRAPPPIACAAPLRAPPHHAPLWRRLARRRRRRKIAAAAAAY